MRISIEKPDNYGVAFSSLCMLHCYLTPLLFLTQGHLSFVPGWWQSLNFLFLALSFLAICFSVKNSTSLVVKFLLFTFWFALAFLLISEEFEFFHLPEAMTYAAGFSLAFLHIYNNKYCNCNDGECCVD